ncbi:DUF3179 domain-containing protein [Natronomonas sp. EA1]|uniref:DUF3179 domain-containing protein n=1 Tax=Natronomonas sp. EA1 TaxID=3421655 RepID=UPI003EBE7330
MRRRRLLTALATGTAGGLAGCQVGYHGDTTVGGVSLPVPREELTDAVATDHIPAIVDPAFARDWSGLDVPANAELQGLPDETAVVGVQYEGVARAYPLAVLDWHEVVNAPQGLLVTYCPLCGSAVVTERVIDGAETVFGVSGALWRNDLVLYDRRTESLWSQLLATAIRGPKTGTQLSLVPASLTSWEAWRAEHPDTEVLLPPPHSNTVRGRDATFSYFNSKYNYETQTQLIGYDGTGVGPRTLVVGLERDGVTRAYPFPAVAERGVVNDRVGDLPVVVTVTPDGGLAAYERGVDGRVLSFRGAGPGHLRAGGSRWVRTTGEAVDGPFRGTTLGRAADLPPMFWSGWSAFHPDTELFGR